MFFSKKGDFSDLKNIILIIFVAVILLSIMNMIIKGGSRGSDIASCRNWVVISSIKDPAIGALKLDLKNPCTTFQDKLEGDEYDVYETLAKSMHDTWKMYGQGKIDFFSDWDWGKKNTYCFVGDEIKIDKNIKIKELDINKFEEYLSNTYVPKSEITYAEFFTGAENINLDFGSDNIELKKDEKLYVMFTIKKINKELYNELFGFNKEALIKGGIVSGGGCIGGGITGAKIGGIIGFFAGLGVASPATGPSGAVIGGTIGCVVGMVSTTTLYSIGYADDLYPGLILVSQKDLSSLEESCDGGIHYKPK